MSDARSTDGSDTDGSLREFIADTSEDESSDGEYVQECSEDESIPDDESDDNPTTMADETHDLLLDLPRDIAQRLLDARAAGVDTEEPVGVLRRSTRRRRAVDRYVDDDYAEIMRRNGYDGDMSDDGEQDP
jgi:hypothetical protein